jgi:hypothetical protein
LKGVNKLSTKEIAADLEECDKPPKIKDFKKGLEKRRNWRPQLREMKALGKMMNK